MRKLFIKQTGIKAANVQSQFPPTLLEVLTQFQDREPGAEIFSFPSQFAATSV